MGFGGPGIIQMLRTARAKAATLSAQRQAEALKASTPAPPPSTAENLSLASTQARTVADKMRKRLGAGQGMLVGGIGQPNPRAELTPRTLIGGR